jgi:hypothetical protein
MKDFALHNPFDGYAWHCGLMFAIVFGIHLVLGLSPNPNGTVQAG